MIGAVNLAEVSAKLADGGLPAAAITDALTSLALDVRRFDASLALASGLLWPQEGPR